MPIAPRKVGETPTLRNLQELQQQFNVMVEYQKSLRPIASDDQQLNHTALGTFRGGGTSTAPTTTTQQAPRWG